MPGIYGGALPGGNPVFTAYAGVAGPSQLFQGGGDGPGEGIRLADITDGASNTIGMGPVPVSTHIPWTAPVDIQIENAPALGLPEGFGVVRESATPMWFVDGSVKLLPNTTDAATILALATIAGGEVLP
jgi:hypothetical protein